MKSVLAILAAGVLLIAGCGGTTHPSSSPAASGSTVASLSGFYLRSGQPATVQFYVHAKGLRVIAVVASPTFRCVLAQRTATGGSQVRAGDIPMTEVRHPYPGGGNATEYDFSTRGPLQPGWYQLTLLGHGRVWTFGAAQF